jgi:hypothetical protein
VVVLWNGEVSSWYMKEKEGRGDNHSIYKEKGYDEIWEVYYPSVIFPCSSL